ncbi:MAG: adenine phosphoribosyltransferase [Candidatus Omnitrophota bacterium]
MAGKALDQYIRDIPDFPKKGIIFKDITPLLKDAGALRRAVSQMARQVKDQPVDYVVGIESRGFIFGAALAVRIGAGFIPVRKTGKLPHVTKRVMYDLEYGTDTLEMHKDALTKGGRVLIVDDLLATGGTAQAVVRLVRSFQAKLTGALFLVELSFLKGRKKLRNVPVMSLLQYD